MTLRAVVAACLCVAGLVVVAWYAKWGVHGCNDSGGSCSERMDRDHRVYLVGLATLAAGVLLGIGAAVRALRRS